MIKVLKAGLLTTLQDMGRYGSRKFGVPVSGAMDLHSAGYANSLLANQRNAAVLEITLQGPELEFTAATQIVISGADLSPTINNEVVSINNVLSVSIGDVLSFGARLSGVRSYLAINGGFEDASVLNSKSWYAGITPQDKLAGGELLVSNPISSRHLHHDITPLDFSHASLMVFEGPEFDLLNDDQKNGLQNQFTVGLNNRMGYQLNELIENELPSILSSAVLPGTVQLTPSGKLIVLMRDCQTTGGYPRVLQLSEEAIDILSQKMSRETVQFEL